MLTGPNPTDRAKLESKRHLICDGHGVPLAVRLTGANRNDSQEALALVDAIPPLRGERSRPRRRPVCVLGDRGYDAAVIRHSLRARHVLPLLATRGTKNGSGLGQWRWVVERTFAWLNQFRRLRAPLRQAGRHPRGVPLARLRVDLLALTAKGMDDALNAAALPLSAYTIDR
jgi:transposase